MRFGKTSERAAKAAPVLDQGIVITGDVLVKLMGLKLLPVKVRLLVSSTKLAGDLGLDWWRDEGQDRSPRTKKRSKSRRDANAVARDAGRNGTRHAS